MQSICSQNDNFSNKFNELNNAKVVYNSDTDKLDVYSEGVLVGSLPCSFQFFDIYNSGNASVTLDYDSYTVYTSTNTAYKAYAPVVGTSHIQLTVQAATSEKSSFGTLEMIDLSKYSKLCANVTWGGNDRKLEVDISSIEEGYICCGLRASNSTNTILGLHVTSAKAKYMDNLVAEEKLTSSNEVSSLTSEYKTATVTRIWLE